MFPKIKYSIVALINHKIYSLLCRKDLMEFLLSIVINAVIFVMLAKILDKVTISGWGAAFIAAVLLGIFSPTIGWLLNVILNVATLGLFLVLGIGFVIRLVATALVIKFVDWLMNGLRIEGFGTALIISVVMALAGSLIQYLLH